MQRINELSALELQRKGLEVLTKDLGISGVVQFLKLYDKGSGDWTKERKNIISELSVENIANEIIAARKS